MDGDGDGYKISDGDCDDGDSGVYPGAPEYCDGRDTNCDGTDDDPGLVSFEGDGIWTDFSVLGAGTQESPADIVLDTDGTLHLCEGAFFGHISIEANANIIGRYGAEATSLSGGGIDSVVRVQTDGVTTSLAGLTLTEGLGTTIPERFNTATSGGGLYCEAVATVSVEGVVFSGNRADAGAGALSGEGCTMTLSSSRFSDNTGDYGAGLHTNASTTHLVDVEFINNVAEIQGGGLRASEGSDVSITGGHFEGNTSVRGGGLYLRAGTVDIEAAVFEGNEATTNGGAIRLARGAHLTALNVIAKENKGGDYGGAYAVVSSTMTLTGGQVLDNQADSGAAVLLDGSHFEVREVSVSGNIGSDNGALQLTDGSTAQVYDSLFEGNGSADTWASEGAVGYTWGDQTSFMCTSLRCGDETSDVDVDGVTEADGDCNDLDEAVYPGAPEYCDGRDTNCDGTLDDPGLVSFESDGVWTDFSEVLGAGTEESPADIVLDTDGTLHLCEGTFFGHVSIEANADIIGRYGAEATSLNGGGIDSVVRVQTDEITTSISGLTLTQGLGTTIPERFNTAVSGGGLYCEAVATVSVEDVVFSENRADAGAGALSGEGCTMTLSSSHFRDNTGDYGAGLHTNFSTTTLVDVDFINNVAEIQGGGLRASEGSDVSIIGGRFEGNVSVRGGGIYQRYGDIDLNNVTFTGNAATTEGGAIHIAFSGILTATDVIASGNSGGNGGGAFAVIDSTLTVTGGSLSGNDAQNGGAILIDGGHIEMSEVICSANEAAGLGGGLYLSDMASARAFESDFENNGDSDTFYADSIERPYTWGGDATFVCSAAGCWEATQEDADGDGFSSFDGDCDDGEASVNPEAPELCDGSDQDCDGGVDEGTDEGGDADGDGFTTCQGDCDDAHAEVYPGAAEGACNTIDNDCDDTPDEDFEADDTQVCSCDGGGTEFVLVCGVEGLYCPAPGVSTEVCDLEDNDCDGLVDEGLETETYYKDDDGDGYGSSESIEACGQPDGYVLVNGDCDDRDGSIYPNGDDVCDGVDNDCNGRVDEGLLQTYYLDSDQDSYGDDDESIEACSQPAGYVDQGQDCDDSDSDVNAEALESCNQTDDDCDGEFDEGLTADSDDDGYTSLGSCSGSQDDCDDSRPGVNPGEQEKCNGRDKDCDGIVDEGFDQDGDDYYTCSASGLGQDCDDNNELISPMAEETCNGLDDNCDDVIDEGYDGDGDGFYQCDSGGKDRDCDDDEPTINPGAEEECNNGVDEDCQSSTDCRESIGEQLNPSDATQLLVDSTSTTAALEYAYDGVVFGDFNGDGFLDLVVPSPEENFMYGPEFYSNTGSIYVKFGPIDPEESFNIRGPGGYDFKIDGELGLKDDSRGSFGGRFGQRLSVGDFDGDGSDELLVAAPEFGRDPGTVDSGAVYLFNGDDLRSNGHADERSSARFYGVRAEEYLGRSLGDRMDIDRDGCDDIVMGAPGASSAYWLSVDPVATDGYVSVFYGSGSACLDQGEPIEGTQNPSVDSDVVFYTDAPVAQLGDALAAIDLGPDALSLHLVVGASRAFDNKSEQGVSYLVQMDGLSGLVKIEEAAALSLRGHSEGEHSGESLAVSDLDNDGIPDLLVGASEATPNDKDQAGMVYGISGVVLADAIDVGVREELWDMSRRFVTDDAGDRLGFLLEAGGDFDGDGAQDLILGNHRYRRSCADSRTYIHYGPIPLDPETELHIDRYENFDHYIRYTDSNGCMGSPLRLGDIDNDGRDELMVTSRHDTDYDRFYLFSGAGE